MKKTARGGYTLVEVIVSMMILTIVVAGFAAMFTGNTRVISRNYRYGRHNHTLLKQMENGTGVKTGRTQVLTFEADELGLAGDFILDEYEIQSNRERDTEMYFLYYYK